MATDIIARGLAVSNSGSGGGSTSVDIQDGVGIEFTGSDPIIINNGGITNVQTGNDSDDNGTIRVTYGKDSKTKSVPVKGLNNAAYKNVDTVIDESTKDSENLPTTKAVKKVLDSKIDSSKLGESNGIATLDEYKKLVSDQLPSHNHGSNEVDAMTNYQKPSTLAEKEIKETDSLNTAIGKLEKNLDDKMDDGNYAGSSTKGGSATSAEKLSNTEQIGTNKKPVYFSADGIPVAIDHTINSDVPENAKFTDTKYSAGTGIRVADDTMYNMGVLSVNESATNGCVDFTIGKNGTETSESKTIPVHGLGDAAYKSVDTVVTKDSANLITSGAVSAELDKKMDSSTRNSANGVAGLDSNSKINVSQIPTTDEYNVGSAYPVTGKAIEAAMNTLPNPMLYKGSLGTGGTITALPTASASNEGFTYKVITSGTYAGQSAKVGDVFISNGTEWTIIPSGDEPEGTVISVGMSVPIGLKIKEGTSPVTTSGTIEVQLDEGYVIPKTVDIVPSTRKINNITLESDVVLDGDDIKATGYAKAESKSNIAGTDTINQALGKLELKSDTNETNISMLKKHVTGELTDSDFQEDSTAVMTKTVPSGMSDYAAVKMIGGKTYKRNLFNKDGDWFKESSSNAVTVNGSTITVTGTWFCAIPVNVKANTVYSISGTIISGTVNGLIAVLNKDKSNPSLKLLPNIGYNSGTFNSESNTVVWVALYSGRSSSGTSVYKDIQLEEGSVANPYVPFGLISTPVESVASQYPYDNNINVGYTRIDDGELSVNAYRAVSDLITIKNNTIYYSVSSKTKNITDIAFQGYNSSNKKIYDSAWISLTGKFTYPVDGVAKACVVLRYPDDSEILANDINFSWSANKTTLLIPGSDRNLPCFGYGINETVQNIRDYENGTYTQMVAEVDLGDLNWTVEASYPNSFIASIVEIQMDEQAKIGNILCDKYTADSFDKTVYAETDKTIALGTAHNIAITDKSYTNATTFKEAMKGVKLVYELETPVITDCSDMLMPIRCESGGTITFNNEHNLDMPNSIMYKKEVSLL